jgi:gliding motility-associated-like protein
MHDSLEDQPLLNMRTTTALFLFVLLTSGIQAQIFPITQGFANSCTGALVDSGGEGGPGYGNNENYTFTICPDQPGEAISLQWVIFNLSTQGNAPIDQMSFYDGATVDAPLIGSWTGTGSPGVISASFANTSGCITLVFTSNNTGTGAFAAAITCFQPCEPPTAVASITGEVIPALVCQGEEITFNATASYAASGFNITSYKWHFADGSVDSTSGAIAQHAFSQAGEYMVQLVIEDDNNCVNTNLVDLQVLVSTTPLFTGITASQTICTGGLLEMNATTTTPVTWSGIPESNLGGPVELPDLQGVPFSTTIAYTSFTPGQTLQSPDDLDVCVNMEHSFMGDLVISLTCPNGQSVTFHQQGGGGTFLGDANDMDGNTPVLGECWNYCWSNSATLGTWAQESNNNNMPASQGSALIPDTYSSVQPFSQFVGCPLNGTWTFTVVDLWALDNGFLCDWQIDFDPALFPDLTEFTPDLGLGSQDSAYWVGPGISGQGPATGVITPSEPGEYDYTFYVVDNFGCTYDTTITIIVLQGPDVDLVITGTDTICEGGIAQLGATPGFEDYVWSNNFTGPYISTPAGTYMVTATFGECSQTSPPFTVGTLPQPVPVIVGPGLLCGNEPVTLTTTEQYDSYAWSTGSTEPSIVVGAGTYWVTVDNGGCAGTTPLFNIIPASDPQASFTTDPLPPQNVGVTVDMINNSTGNGAPLIEHHWTFGTSGAESFDHSPTHTFNTPGTHFITLVVTASDGCTDTATVAYAVIPEAVQIVNVITPNGDGVNDVLVFENAQYFGNELFIFDRWGTTVYEQRNYQNNWRASDVTDGTYFFVLKLDNGQEYSGPLNILR